MTHLMTKLLAKARDALGWLQTRRVVVWSVVNAAAILLACVLLAALFDLREVPDAEATSRGAAASASAERQPAPAPRAEARPRPKVRRAGSAARIGQRDYEVQVRERPAPRSAGRPVPSQPPPAEEPPLERAEDYPTGQGPSGE
ncbi:MAG: hypothetical protein HY721_26010 [Planctomycetes bacterium]|nr:hypothetical protein [Planctomycetota bacterium]